MFFSFVGLVLAAVCLLGEAVKRWFRANDGLRWVCWRWSRWLLMDTARMWRNNVLEDEETLWRDDVEKSPKNGRGLMIYGLTQMSKGNYPVALDLYQRALVYTPNYATLEVNLGIVTAAMGKETEADKHFQRAVALTPADDTPQAYYGRYLLAQGRFADAIVVLRQSVALNGARMMQRDLLIEALARSGDTTGALDAATDALRMDPTDREARNAIEHPVAQGAVYWSRCRSRNTSAGSFRSRSSRHRRRWGSIRSPPRRTTTLGRRMPRWATEERHCP